MNDKTIGSIEDENLTSHSDDWVVQALNTHLNTKVDALDFNVTSSLSAARHRALASGVTNNSNRTWTGQLFGRPVLFAGAAVIAVTVFLGTQFMPEQIDRTMAPTAQMAQRNLIEDMNLLTASEDIEFFEYIEFLEWMDSNAS